jgi:hypothetical protein
VYFLALWNNSNKLETNTPNMPILEAILKSFDNSILSVSKISESEENPYIVKFANNHEAFIKEGKIINHERFSRGTIESIEVADFLNYIMLNPNFSGCKTLINLFFFIKV